ncbi:MAG: response regulator [Deltaproteobacteria bacterium]|nr:response regulator [Deltaproteobacteria bacterium]
MKSRVLIVDDAPNILSAYKRELKDTFEVVTALSGEQGLRKVIQEEAFSVVIADAAMPGIDGFEFLDKLKELSPGTVRIMLTGDPSQKLAVRALNEGGIFQFLTKPCSAETLFETIRKGVIQYNKNLKTGDVLRATHNGIVELLGQLLMHLNPFSGDRLSAVKKITLQLMEHILPGKNDLSEIQIACDLLEVGMLALPSSLRHKISSAEALTKDDETVLTTHPRLGSELLKRIPSFDCIAEYVYLQDKGFDGSGFPTDSISGSTIPFEARLIKVAKDIVKHKKEGALGHAAIEQLEKNSAQYDPEILFAAATLFGKKAENVANDDQILVISLEEVRVGYITVLDIRAVDNSIVIPAGSSINDVLMERLINYATLVGVKEPISVLRPAISGKDQTHITAG